MIQRNEPVFQLDHSNYIFLLMCSLLIWGFPSKIFTFSCFHLDVISFSLKPLSACSANTGGVYMRKKKQNTPSSKKSSLVTHDPQYWVMCHVLGWMVSTQYMVCVLAMLCLIAFQDYLSSQYVAFEHQPCLRSLNFQKKR